MNLVEYMRAGWASATAFFGVNLADTPSIIKGPAREPENWRHLGTDDVRQALTEQHWKVGQTDPRTLLPSNLPLPLQAGGPGSGRRPSGTKISSETIIRVRQGYVSGAGRESLKKNFKIDDATLDAVLRGDYGKGSYR